MTHADRRRALIAHASLRPVGEPLLSLDRSGFYEGDLASAIDAGCTQLRQTS